MFITRWVARLSVAGLAALVSAPSPSAALQGAPPSGSAVRAVSAEAHPCLNVRSRPSYRAILLDCLEVGRLVTVRQVQDGWSQITAGEDVAGWVGSRFLVDEGIAPEAVRPEPEAAAPPQRADQGPTGAGDRVAVEPDERAGLASELARRREEQLTERLRAAEELASSREAELATARASMATAVAEAEDLATRVQELTDERDRLASQLTRAEARVLYLQADLEETRSELMRLKGIPPKLVAPEPASQPEPPAVPAPEPEPVEASAEAPFELPAGENFAVLEEVVGTVRAWAQAWSDQRADDYLSFYADSFTPRDGVAREVWAAGRRDRIRSPRSIEVVLEDVSPVVTGERAIVTFAQSYTSDTFSDRVTKTLVLERSPSGTWLIVEERVD